MTTTAKYKVGIVGCGRQGTQHGRGFNLLPDTSVVAIADPDPDNLKLALRRFSARGYSTAEEMYANEQLDIVDCVLPVQFNPGHGRSCRGNVRREGNRVREADRRQPGRRRPHGRRM